MRSFNMCGGPCITCKSTCTRKYDDDNYYELASKEILIQRLKEYESKKEDRNARIIKGTLIVEYDYDVVEILEESELRKNNKEGAAFAELINERNMEKTYEK